MPDTAQLGGQGNVGHPGAALVDLIAHHLAVVGQHHHIPDSTQAQARLATRVAGYHHHRRPALDGNGSSCVNAPLEDVAAVADEVAAELRPAAGQARSMQRRRDRGISWARILDEQSSPTLLERLRRSARRLIDATGQAGRALAAGLMADGLSRRQIGRRLGVSHQRVSAMLSDSHRSSRSDR